MAARILEREIAFH